MSLLQERGYSIPPMNFFTSKQEPHTPVVKMSEWLPILASERSELVAKVGGAERHRSRGLGAQPPAGSRGGAPGGGLGGRSPPENF